ncbi:TetR/AcrR family transcriptional regulator [Actinomadura parmotrematis]|uniref:TetR/AcrR family transcriptional regulator n=1 Tax=Actinomadura parmotrematis TaxID=2864039 RepID=A0ABS7FPT1_9ACTN|nr:TetR/AcrR family transcriptional regulator [Actinomadura parmotrematis]MBW8482321.1 TetR/AcrR family transcriptional regulator [Actinomadura parmotrematis]
MPKKVDHEERRRAIAEAVFAVIGSRGLEAVSLRDVAEEAGVSMGAVQHYFASKQDMLLFALSHMRERVLVRLQAAVGALEAPSRLDVVRAALRVMLPVDEPGRQEACVNVAFFSAAAVNPAYADQLRAGYARILAVSEMQLREAAAAGELHPGADPKEAAATLYFLAQGLVGPLLIGLYTPDEALDLVERHLARVFKTA